MNQTTSIGVCDCCVSMDVNSIIHTQSHSLCVLCVHLRARLSRIRCSCVHVLVCELCVCVYVYVCMSIDYGVHEYIYVCVIHTVWLCMGVCLSTHTHAHTHPLVHYSLLRAIMR